MLQRQPSYYNEFCCKASACGDNCCVGWEIEIDRESEARYRALSGDMGKRLRAKLSGRETDGLCHFMLNGDGRCPFLREDNLCELISELGEDSLCQICAEHPRFYEWYDGFREAGIGLCCEAAAELLLGWTEPAELLWINLPEEEVSFGKSGEAMEPELCGSRLLEEQDPFLRFLFSARDACIALLQDRTFPLAERLLRLTEAAESLQAETDAILSGEVPEGEMCREELTGRFAEADRKREMPCGDGSAADGRIERLTGEFLLSGESGAFWEEAVRLLLSLPANRTDWTETLSMLCLALPEVLSGYAAYAAESVQTESEREQLSVYFLYRHFMDASFDGNVKGRILFAAFGTQLIELLSAAAWLRGGRRLSRSERVRICTMYSREIEYSRENEEAVLSFLTGAV